MIFNKLWTEICYFKINGDTHTQNNTQLLTIFKHKFREYGLQVEVLRDKNHINITDKRTWQESIRKHLTAMYALIQDELWSGWSEPLVEWTREYPQHRNRTIPPIPCPRNVPSEVSCNTSFVHYSQKVSCICRALKEERQMCTWIFKCLFKPLCFFTNSSLSENGAKKILFYFTHNFYKVKAWFSKPCFIFY